MKTFFRITALVALAAMLGACAPAAQEPAPEAAAPAPEAAEQPQASLYDRLGGEEAIAAVVDRFIDVLGDDEVLNANPAIKEARDQVDTDELKANVTALMCQATGGPEEYTGRTMAEAHAGLNISGTEWDEMISQFVGVLNEFGVPEQEQGELVAIMDSTKADIVLRPEE